MEEKAARSTQMRMLLSGAALLLMPGFAAAAAVTGLVNVSLYHVSLLASDVACGAICIRVERLVVLFCRCAPPRRPCRALPAVRPP